MSNAKKFSNAHFLGEYYFTEESILAMANPEIPEPIRLNYGNMILAGLGYNGDCDRFFSENYVEVRIGWVISTEYYERCCMDIFSAKEIAEKLKDKVYHVEMSIER